MNPPNLDIHLSPIGRLSTSDLRVDETTMLIQEVSIWGVYRHRETVMRALARKPSLIGGYQPPKPKSPGVQVPRCPGVLEWSPDPWTVPISLVPTSFSVLQAWRAGVHGLPRCPGPREIHTYQSRDSSAFQAPGQPWKPRYFIPCSPTITLVETES